MAREGLPYVLIPVLLALAALFLYWPLALALLSLAAFMAFFFRDPRRQPPPEQGIVVSPADGRVTRVEQLSPGASHSGTVVSIFLSPLDVHINRAPIGGRISRMTYTPGKFLMATKDEASLVNEQ
ncbi:MAG TPA: phosphatidylserine decarboxylase, partial [Pyrinomonadaceae bacterium]